MPESPSINGSNGRNARGQFVTGNPGGPGNPHIKKVAALRATLLKTVTHRDLQAIVKSLIERAKAGDVLAAREVFDRCFGKPRQGVDMDLDVGVGSIPRSGSQAGIPDISQMSDLEIAELIESANLPVPTILKAKADLIRSQAKEQAVIEKPSATPHQSRPSRKPYAPQPPKKRPGG